MRLKEANLLYIATKFGDPSNPYLTDLFADKLKNEVLSLDVIDLNWDGKKSKTNNSKKNVYWLNSNLMANKLKWIIAPIFSFIALKNSKKIYDIIIVYSPLYCLWPFIIFHKARGAKIVCVQWDFFPISQVKSGKIKNKLLEICFKRIEDFLHSQCCIAFVLDNKNKKFLKEYHSYDGKIVILGLWGRGNEKSIFVKYNKEKKILIYGGQIILGRDFDLLTKIFEELKKIDNNYELWFVGSGEESERLKRVYKNRVGINFLDWVIHDQYKKMLSRCTVGVIVTNFNADLPTYPSKIIDYTSIGLPILAIMETESELGFAIDKKFGVYVYNEGDILLKAQELHEIINCETNYRNASHLSREYYEAEFCISAKVRIFIENVQSTH